MEVQLAWTGNESRWTLGSCHASPHMAGARLARRGREPRKVCNTPSIAPSPSWSRRQSQPSPTHEERIPAQRPASTSTSSRPEVAQGHRSIVALLPEVPEHPACVSKATPTRASVAVQPRCRSARERRCEAVFPRPRRGLTRIFDFKGSGRPGAPGRSPAGFALNWRVEMVFVDSDGATSGRGREGDLQLEGATPVQPKKPAAKKPARRQPSPAAPAKPKAVASAKTHATTTGVRQHGRAPVRH